jgi:hypothetical protein
LFLFFSVENNQVTVTLKPYDSTFNDKILKQKLSKINLFLLTRPPLDLLSSTVGGEKNDFSADSHNLEGTS